MISDVFNSCDLYLTLKFKMAAFFYIYAIIIIALFKIQKKSKHLRI